MLSVTQGTIFLLVKGGRCRVIANFTSAEDPITWLVPTGATTFGNQTVVQPDSLTRQDVLRLIEIYGSVPYQTQYEVAPSQFFDCLSERFTAADIKSTNTFDIYENCGFVEGQARITTPVGDAACVVKNGTLYPILTEYDQATEDNWTLQDVYLNGDNEVSNLQQMVDRSGTYLAYTEDQEADKWSPIENYLHMHVKMPIVPKIGYVPAQQVGLGNVLPGLNYAVTL